MTYQRAQELEDFKTKADLREVAAWLGFAEDRKASDRNHTVMRDAAGRKLVVGINADTGHWCYSDNQGAHGTVIDLVQQVRGETLGQVRRTLRPLVGAPERRPEIDRTAYEPKPRPKPTKGNAIQAKAEWEAAQPVTQSAFLQKARGLSAATLSDARFVGCYRVDARQNAVFPYWHAGELVAVERRNRPPQGSDKSFKGYTAGAVPGVWVSHSQPTDRRLVVVESPIDAMAFHQMHGDDKTRYVALRQGYDAKDLEAVIKAMPPGSEIVAATDMDPQGRKYAQEVVHAAAEAGYIGRAVMPGHGANDWNDALRAEQAHQWRKREEEANQWTPSGPGM